MKDINEYLNEQLLTETTQWKANTAGSSYGRGADMLNCEYRGNKKFGFLCYDETTSTIHLLAADSAGEIADMLNVEADTFEPIFKLGIGQSLDEGGHYTMRIW